VRLMTALSTASSHVGDIVSMEVVDDDGAWVKSLGCKNCATKIGPERELAVEIQTVKARRECNSCRRCNHGKREERVRSRFRTRHDGDSACFWASEPRSGY
jgi:hypothetical protein